MSKPDDAIFDIRNRNLRFDTRADIEPHLKEIKDDLLEEFYIADNTVGIDAAEALKELFIRSKRLRVAALPDIFGTRTIDEVPSALTSICTGLTSLTSLVELNLGNNALGGRAVHPLVPLLVENRSIQVFKLNNNGLGPEGGKVVAQALLESAKRSKEEGRTSQLRVLICGKNRLEDGSAPSWGEVFAAHTNLQKVKMVNNGFREAGMKAIAKGLLHCSDLRFVCFRDATTMQDVDDPSVDDGEEHAWTILAELMRKATLLEFVDFSDCGLNIPGSLAIIRALGSVENSRLRTLLLENNDMTAEVYDVLKDAIEDNLQNLATLSIAWNEDLEEDVVQELTDILTPRGGRGVLVDDEADSEQKDIAADNEKDTTVYTPATEAASAATGEDDDVDDLLEKIAKLKVEA